MAYLKPTPTTEQNKLVGKISDGQSVKLTVPNEAKATGQTGVGVTNGVMTWEAVLAGIAGNGITIVQQDPKANSQSLAITVSGKTIIISLATDGTGVITTTAAGIKTAIEANADASALVTVAYSGTGAGLAKDENAVLSGGTDLSVTAKKFYLVSHFFGMAMADAEPGGEVILDLEKAEYATDQLKSGDTFSVGSKLYWDDTNNYFTVTAGALTLVGIVTQAKDDSGVIYFKLTNSVI